MDNFFMKPKIDFVFKEIMEDETARIGFLSSILHLNPSDIKNTRILNSFLRKIHRNDKFGILDFVLFNQENDFYFHFHITEDIQHFTYTDNLEFHVIELPKLPKRLRPDSSGIELWARFINTEKLEESHMIAEKDPYIESAYNRLQVISQDNQKRLEYEAREKAIRDYNQAIYESEKRGEERGEKRGEKLSSLKIVNKLISMEYSFNEIMEITGLTADQIDDLRR